MAPPASWEETSQYPIPRPPVQMTPKLGAEAGSCRCPGE